MTRIARLAGTSAPPARSGGGLLASLGVAAGVIVAAATITQARPAAVSDDPSPEPVQWVYETFEFADPVEGQVLLRLHDADVRIIDTVVDGFHEVDATETDRFAYHRHPDIVSMVRKADPESGALLASLRMAGVDDDTLLIVLEQMGAEPKLVRHVQHMRHAHQVWLEQPPAVIELQLHPERLPPADLALEIVPYVRRDAVLLKPMVKRRVDDATAEQTKKLHRQLEHLEAMKRHLDMVATKLDEAEASDAPEAAKLRAELRHLRKKAAELHEEFKAVRVLLEDDRRPDPAPGGRYRLDATLPDARYRPVLHEYRTTLPHAEWVDLTIEEHVEDDVDEVGDR